MWQQHHNNAILMKQAAGRGDGEHGSMERRGKFPCGGTGSKHVHTLHLHVPRIILHIAPCWFSSNYPVGISAMWPWWLGLYNARWVGCAVQEPWADRRRKTGRANVLARCRQRWTHLLWRIQSWIQGTCKYMSILNWLKLISVTVRLGILN